MQTQNLSYWKMREGSGDEVSIGEGEGLDCGMELLAVLGGLKKVL